MPSTRYQNLIALFLVLGVAFIWRFRSDLNVFLPQSLQQATVQAPAFFVDPSDIYVGPPVVLEKPPFDMKHFEGLANQVPHQNAQADEMMLGYIEDVMGRDPYGQSILAYPEPLRGIAATLSVEWHVNGEGMGGYVFNGGADSLRFAQHAYQQWGHPELAQILAQLEHKFQSGYADYLRARSGKGQAGEALDFTSAFLSVSEHLDLEPLDTAWYAYTGWDRLYADRRNAFKRYLQSIESQK
jgi:hypothetical protein